MVLYWLAVNTAVYVTYTPLRFKIVYGLQGRYFLPLVFLAVPLLKSQHLKLDAHVYKRLAVGLPVFLLLCSTLTIYIRYFIHNV